MNSRLLLRRLPSVANEGKLLRASPSFCPTLKRSEFSSTRHLDALPPKAKPGFQTTMPKKGKKTLKIKKDLPPPDPTIGTPEERKAFRTRLVLSNTNANDVPTVQELNADNIRAESSVGKVFRIPGTVLDSLRTLGAFKRSQGWNNYKNPSFLMTQEAWNIGQLMDSSSNGAELARTIRKVIVGERRSGKSVLILQVLSMALLKGWVVMNIPDSRELTDSVTTDYAPVKDSNPAAFIQGSYTARFLSNMAHVNHTVLKNLIAAKSHDLPTKMDGKPTLLQLAEIGARDNEQAWPMFEALWTELNVQNNSESQTFGSRPPILFCADNISYLFCPTQYRVLAEDESLKAVHAFDLLLPKLYIDLLTGHQSFSNGGAVLGATSTSNVLNCPPLEVGIRLAEARNAADGPKPTVHQFWNPLEKIDRRVLKHVEDLDVVRLRGLSKQCARELIEYWALSGLVRDHVKDNYVGQKWVLSGGGVIGELEKAVVASLTAGV